MSDILKLEPTEPRNPTPYDVKLKFDKPKELPPKQEGWSPSWMYGIVHEGADKIIYATKGLHRAIQETGASAGDELSIIRIGSGKETRWDVMKNGEVGEAQVRNSPDPFVQTPAPNTGPNARQKFVDNLKRYRVAFNKAVDFRDGVEEVVDLNAVAFTFYKMAQDAGFDLLELDSGNE